MGSSGFQTEGEADSTSAVGIRREMEKKNLIPHNNALIDKSQDLEEKEVEIASLKPFFTDYDLVPVFGKLQDLLPLVCATTSEGDFVVFHESLWRVLLERGVEKVKALFFKGVWDMAELFYLRENSSEEGRKPLWSFTILPIRTSTERAFTETGQRSLRT